MEPRIQYTKTEDGVNIAFWTMGEGAPLVITPPLSFSHISLECRSPGLSEWYESLAERRMVIRYDPRGNGLSQRELDDSAYEHTWGAHDIEAVVQSLGLERLSLIGVSIVGAQAISFAAKHSPLVEQLILINPPSVPNTRAPCRWAAPASRA